MHEDTVQPPSALGIAIKPWQEAALMKGMAVLQRDRLQNIQELCDALYATKASIDPVAAPVPVTVAVTAPVVAEPVAVAVAPVEPVAVAPEPAPKPKPVPKPKPKPKPKPAVTAKKPPKAVFAVAGIAVIVVVIIAIALGGGNKDSDVLAVGGGETQTRSGERTPATEKAVSAEVGDIIKFGGYDWLVLDKQSDKALIISENVLEKREYNEEYKSVITWETCTLRAYLNGDFYNSFSESDKKKIIKTKNKNPDNQWYNTDGGNDTEDYIFLLSLDEVVKYFGDSGQLKNRPSKESYSIDDQYNEKRIAYFNGENDWWWLRSPDGYGNNAAFVRSGGTVDVSGHFVIYGNYDGVRPALWLKID